MPKYKLKHVIRQTVRIQFLLPINISIKKFSNKPYMLWLLPVGKLMELHGEGSSSKGAGTGGEGADTGDQVTRPEGYEPPVQEAV